MSDHTVSIVESSNGVVDVTRPPLMYIYIYMYVFCLFFVCNRFRKVNLASTKIQFADTNYAKPGTRFSMSLCCIDITISATLLQKLRVDNPATGGSMVQGLQMSGASSITG